MSVWSARLDCLVQGTGPGGEAALVLTIAGSFGFRAFQVEQGGRRFDPIAEWEHPTLLATAVQWSRGPAHGPAGSGAPDVAWLLVPARGTSPDGTERELRPTDVWMWSLKAGALERFLCFGAPVTAIQRVPGPMRSDARIAICLPGEVFVFEGRKLQHRFGVACCPSPAEERDRQREAAARAAAAGSSWGPPDLSAWRPAAALSGRFLAVAAADAAPEQTEAAAKAARSVEPAGLSLRAVARDAAVGLLRLGDTVDSAGRIASAAGWAAVDRARAAAHAALDPAAGAASDARPRMPQAAPELRRAAAGMRPPDRWQTLLSALAGAAAEADAAAAAGGGQGSVAVVDLESARVVAHWKAVAPGQTLAAVALSATGSALATATGSGQLVQLWRVLPPPAAFGPLLASSAVGPSHRLLAVLDRGLQPSPVRALCLAADASLVACATLRDTLHVWAPGARALSLRGEPGGVVGDDAGPSLAFVGGLAGDGKEVPAGHQEAADGEGGESGWPAGRGPAGGGGTDARRAPSAREAGVAQDVVVADVAATAFGWRAAQRRRGAADEGGDAAAREGGSEAGSSVASSARSASPLQSSAQAGAEETARRPATTARVHTKAARGPSASVPVISSFARLPLQGVEALAALVKAGGGEPRLKPAPQTGAPVTRGDVVAVSLWDRTHAGSGRDVLVAGTGATGGLAAVGLAPAASSAAPGQGSHAASGVSGSTSGPPRVSSASVIAAGLTAVLGRAGLQAEEAVPVARAVPVADAIGLAQELEGRADAGGVAWGGCSSRWAQAAASTSTGPSDRATAGAGAGASFLPRDGLPSATAGVAARLPAIPASTAPWYPIPPWQRPNVRLRRAQGEARGAAGAWTRALSPAVPSRTLELPLAAVLGAPLAAPSVAVGEHSSALQEALGGTLGSPTER